MEKRIIRDWHGVRKYSLYQLRGRLFVVTVRTQKKVDWYPIEGTETEAIYTYNRILNCLMRGQEFVVSKGGDENGERVITDPTIIENLIADEAIRG